MITCTSLLHEAIGDVVEKYNAMGLQWRRDLVIQREIVTDGCHDLSLDDSRGRNRPGHPLIKRTSKSLLK